MASRVNTRFVIILIVGVIAALGLLVVAWNIANKSPSDLARAGDELMAQGEYRLASKNYSKAVNKDSTNVENLNKWIDAIEMIVPETETEYRSMFNGDYMGAIGRTATVLRNDADAHERYIAIRNQMLKSGYSRGNADAIIAATNSSLAFFTDTGGEVQPWERLKRYRGLAIVQIARHDGVLEDNQYTLAQDDLERAIIADPEDVDSIIGLMNIMTLITEKDRSASDEQARIDTRAQTLKMADDFLARHPENAQMLLQRVMLNVDDSFNRIDTELSSTERFEAITAAMNSYQDELSAIADKLLGEASDQLDIELLNTFLRLEAWILSDNNLSYSRSMIDQMIATDKDNAQLLRIAGKIAKEAGDLDEAIGWFAQIDELETKPVSFEGLNQFSLQRMALHDQASIRVDQVQALPSDTPQDEIDAAIAIAKEIRDRYASTVTDDELNLVLLDGKIARVSGDTDEALRLFKNFNEQTRRNNADGLWEEGLTALQIDQFGVAREALSEMLKFDNNTNRKKFAMRMLAQIEINLKNYSSAANYYREILNVHPTWQVAIDELAAVELLLNPQLHEDPVISAVLTARQIKLGTSSQMGDFAGAIEYLREAIETHNYDPMIARELSSMILDNGDIENARVVLSKSVELHPSDESLQDLLRILESNDTVDIRVELQRQSGRDTLESLLSIAKIAADNDREQLLADTVEELNVIAPNDKRVVDATFLHAIKYGNLDLARSIASRPENTALEALGFNARIAITQGDTARAIELFKQAAATGTADASIYQMLAILQRESGMIDDAIQSFESALSIRPDNSKVITEYLWTLAVSARQYEEALSTARRLQLHGSSNPTFMNLWLNLESNFGGSQGRDFAIRQRERLLELNPANLENKSQLARLYIKTKQWDASKALIDQLRSDDDQLVFVELEATWYADQGSVNNQNGLILANQVYADYIESLTPPVDAGPFVSNSEFMLSRGRPDLAITAANEAVKRQSPETMLGSKLLGDLYMRINDLSQAIESYKLVIENEADPDFSYHNRLVEAYVRLERFEDAQATFSKLPAEMKTGMVTMFQEADIARGIGDQSRGESILNDAVARYPNNAAVYIKRAEFMIGDETLINDLLSDIGRAIDLNSNSAHAYRVRAAGYFAVDRREDALKDLRTAIRLNPNSDRSIFAVLNELLSQDGRAGEALDVAREMVSRRPDDAILMSRIGGLFKSHNDWEKAAELYGMAWQKRNSVQDGAEYIDALVQMSPPDTQKANEVINGLAQIVGNINDHPGLLAAQSLVLKARGRDDFAQQQITKAFDLSVKNPIELYNWAGNITRYFEEDPVADHINYLEAIKRRNTTPDVHAWLDLFTARRLVLETEIDARAFDILDRLKEYSAVPEIQSRAYQTHGSTLFNQGFHEEAAAVWRAGIELFSDDWEMNNNLAYVLSEKLKKPEEALPYAQVSIDQNIQRSEAYETMAGIYIQLGKYDEAEQMLEIGANFIQGIPARVTMIVSTGRLEYARGNTVDARSRVNDARSVLRSSPTAHPNLEQDIQDLEDKINSADG